MFLAPIRQFVHSDTIMFSHNERLTLIKQFRSNEVRISIDYNVPIASDASAPRLQYSNKDLQISGLEKSIATNTRFLPQK